MIDVPLRSVLKYSVVKSALHLARLSGFPLGNLIILFFSVNSFCKKNRVCNLRNFLMPITENFKIFFLGFIFKGAEWQLQGESVSILVFLLEPNNVALGVTGEFMRLGATVFDSSGVIGFVELLVNSICGIDETRLLYVKNES